MRAKPLTENVARQLAELRNGHREALRTPGWSTEIGQEQWLSSINSPGASIWYWEFEVEDTYTDQRSAKRTMAITVGVGGLVNIDRHNRAAELAVFVHEMARNQGYGQQIVSWLINEAFNAQNMHKVWAEVYDSNPNKDAWPHLLKAWPYHESRRKDVKYWDGRYHDATVYDIINPNE